MPTALQKHKGKAVATAGSLSLAGVIMWSTQHFPSQSEFDMMKERQAETWRAVQDIQTSMIRHGNSATNETTFAARPPIVPSPRSGRGPG